MNNIELLTLIDDFILDAKLTKQFLLNDITTDLSKSNIGQIVFYKINNDQKTHDIFKQRYMDSHRPLLIMNKKPDYDIDNYILISVDNFLHCQKRILDKLFPFERNLLKIIGVTGTNGKSSVVHLSMHLSNMLGRNAICIGTLGAYDSKTTIVDSFGVTSPSYIDLRKLFFKINHTHQAVFMEVSSHALIQNRLFDIELDTAAWTSFSQDHLDYHKTMKEYFQAKTIIFKQSLKNGGEIFIPFDNDSLFQELNNAVLNDNPKKIILKKADTITSYKNIIINKEFNNGFMKTNLEVALALNQNLWGKINKLDLTTITPPKGRFSKIKINEATVIIDYAHTPDALLNIIEAIKREFSNNKLSILFGCGGDRDTSKRPLMGEIASRYADHLFVTSDNPRTENPQKIIDDILAGMDMASNINVILNRREAINTAIKGLQKNDVLLLAGKGHENYQEINGVKSPFDEFEIVENIKKWLHTNQS